MARSDPPPDDWQQRLRSTVTEYARTVKALEEALKGEDKAAIDEKTTALMAASQKLGEKMYAESQAAQAAQTAGGAEAAGASAGGASAKPADDDNVVDAEVKEVKKG